MKLFLCVAALFLSPAAAFTQGNPGPFGGLFGRTPNRSGVDYKVFEIRGSGGGQWNDVVSEEPAAGPEPMFAGLLANAAASATFDRRSDRLNILAGSNLVYRQTLEEHSLTSGRFRNTMVDARLLLSGRLTTRLSADVSASYRYLPFYQFLPSFLWLEGVVAPSLPYFAATVGNHESNIRTGASYQYARHSTLTASASRTEMRFPSSPQGNITSSGFEGLWTRRLNRDFGVRLGYGRFNVSYSAPVRRELIEEVIEAGVDFNRALTISPRTQMRITTGTSILRHANRDARYRLNGDVSLSRRFRRTWVASFNASRSTEFLLGFVEPVFVDAIGLSTSGLLSKRVEWATGLRGTRGEVGSDIRPQRFSMAGATTQLNFAMTRHFGLYAQYAFYYHYSPAMPFLISVPGRVSRQTVTTGIATWIPLFTRERTPLDSR